MLLVWILNLHRNVLQMTAGVNKVASLSDRWQGIWEKRQRERRGKERKRESRPLLIMALACLSLGCAPVRSKGTVCTHCYLFSILLFLNYVCWKVFSPIPKVCKCIWFEKSSDDIARITYVSFVLRTSDGMQAQHKKQANRSMQMDCKHPQYTWICTCCKEHRQQ